MEITALTPFFSTIYKTELNASSLVNVVLENRITRPHNPEVSNRGGWQSGILNYGDVKEVDAIIDNIIPMVAKIYSELGVNPKVTLTGYWMNINKKYNYNIVHNHSGSFISAVLYLKVPKNSGNIVFERTDQLRECLMISEVNERNYGEYYVDTYDNLLLLFPSYMRHRVEQNLSEDNDDERISIAFNFK